MPSPLLHSFANDISQIALPNCFTFPFCYQVHPLAELACLQLQDQVLDERERLSEGKMYGVLVVKDQAGQLGFLAAYSGKDDTHDNSSLFVPQIVDISSQESFLVRESAVINQLNDQISQLSEAARYRELQAQVSLADQAYLQQVGALQAEMATAKKVRKAQRLTAKTELSLEQYNTLDKQLNGQSIHYKKQLLALKASLNTKINQAQENLANYQALIDKLKKQRRKLSNKLQKKLFSQYQLLNLAGESKTISEIFTAFGEQPPAGTGDCAAPKLLQFAFEHGYQPICMAEFWWGQPPKSQIRQHKKYYPACQTKCKPILEHMLAGIELDDNPLLVNYGRDKVIEIIYQDEHILVINKPEELLSVPGKLVQDSVLTRIRAKFPEALGPLIVHRLDMSTSGLMVLALTPRANKSLQQQFVTRQVQKRYVALIEGILNEPSGEITLPLCQDIDDRPRQKVCFESGKPCLTRWQLLGHEGTSSRVLLEPKTGRTHQLRMHCAHPLGFNMPIVGDDLYGNKGKRLCLHAMSLQFSHPVTKQPMAFDVEANF
ncbi:RNA pseudouridine synthase [Thalassotalea sp. LPB0316]|uniref:RluA family pseudouridine synthase n=1 Tax=Thalassotalea sp. LPB0316 TaxID=2769490 RepID=UPI001867D1F4|nr:RluA family pseudouridine synthase [Thalassotalea sp. LPB0316]QOL25099.1 RNA pseudouridine synthase [Thalassotalea sp. LPB0316]